MLLNPPVRTLAVVAAGALATVFAAAAPAGAATHAPAAKYSFKTLDNSNDLTFNQLLGINSHGKIAGYYGSGAQGHKNKGYLLLPPYHQSSYRVENFPHSAQTQVTGLNDTGVTVGFFSHTNKANPADNANFGFWALKGHFHEVVFPASKAPDGKSTPPVDQLLGVNNVGEAAGFYLDSAGNAHGYLYNVFTRKFITIPLPGSVSVTATGINNKNAVVGFFSQSTGPVKSFLVTQGKHLHVHILAVKGADMTQAFGVNDQGEVVGAYTVGANSFGFTWTARGGFHKIADPKGPDATVVNGVNNAGDLVGFYTDAKGNTDGMLATP